MLKKEREGRKYYISLKQRLSKQPCFVYIKRREFSHDLTKRKNHSFARIMETWLNKKKKKEKNSPALTHPSEHRKSIIFE